MENNNTTLIFDFDGTLADTLAFTVNSALEINRNLNLLSEEKIDFEKYRTMDSKDFLGGLKISNLKLIFFIYKYQRKLTKEINNTKTFEGLPEILDELNKIGIRIGICTSNSKTNVRKFLENNKINGFEFIFTSLDYFRKEKILERAIKKYKLRKENVIYVGDEVRDITAARNAGIKVASVSWGYNLESVLLKNSPDYLINQPKDLLNLIL
jgi:HAD superfamily hydrolase (TIGR01662 family)